MDKCFDEGIIQAFLDGELASDLSEKVACHVALCDGCASMLAVAEEESSFAFAALDAEFNTLVPTERIRTRLFETIATERGSFWQKIFGKGFRWTNPSVAAFASLVLVVGLFATLWIVRENSVNAPEVAGNEKPSQTTVAQAIPAKPEESTPIINPPAAPLENDSDVKQMRQAAYKPKNERFEAQKAIYKPVNDVVIPNRVTPVDVPSEAISGEESYIKTIATLQQAVENRKDELMKPSSRVAFEKDMAVVNDAIKKMQREVRKNPKNEAAKEVLRSSYQSKIDLLNSVAEKSELMATLNRK
ncbi:MAG TPA: hypothetical protein VF721_06125 [Pyrinomonadaceae bacterium]|jgi:hypothetical protein